MSYVRFGQQSSSVYIYDDVNGYTTCCGCALGDDLHTTNPDVMAEHLQAHRAAGHTVPDWLDAELREGMEEQWGPPAAISHTRRDTPADPGTGGTE